MPELHHATAVAIAMGRWLDLVGNNPVMPLQLNDFKLNRAVLEIRYASAFLLWDRAGSTWHSLQKIYPEIKISKAANPQSQFIQISKDFTAEVHFDRMNVQGFHLNSDTNDLGTLATTVFGEALRNLEITDLTRIGFRMFFERFFDDKKTMMDAALEILPQLKRPSKKIFNIEDGVVAEPAIAFRLEGPTTGCFVRFHTQEQKLEPEIPREFGPVEFPQKDRNIAIVDVDYYAHTSTAVSKFNAKALIENWTRIVKRDLEAVVNG